MLEIPPSPFELQLNGTFYRAIYAVSDGVVTVTSTYGSAAATAIGEGNYATAITLFFGILNAARSQGLLPIAKL